MVKRYNEEQTPVQVPSFSSEEIFNHFSNVFSNKKTNQLDQSLFPEISETRRTINLMQAENMKDFKFTDENVKKAFFSISNDTSPGPDNIDIKTIKNADPDFSIHRRICNIQLLFGEILPQWKKGRLCLIPKSGKDLLHIESYRPLTIYNVGLRAMMKVLVRTVEGFTDLHPAQKGFIQGENAVENVFKVRRIVEHALKNKKELWVVSFDARAAFDSGSRVHMAECIKR